MTNQERQMVAGYAHAFRQFAANSTDPDDRDRRLYTAKAFERHLSQDLVEQHERRALSPLTRVSEEHPPTRAQERTLRQLEGAFEGVSAGRFLRDGTLIVECFAFVDGRKVLDKVVHIEPEYGTPF